MPKPTSICWILPLALMLEKASARGWTKLGKVKAGTSRNSSLSSNLPMAYRIKIMPRAERDLTDIHRRIQVPTADAARIWYVGLRERIRSLSESPGGCPVTPENEQLRHLLYGNSRNLYRVIFRILEKSKLVEVLHIRHGAMDAFGETE